jgi:hypothetical protein
MKSAAIFAVVHLQLETIEGTADHAFGLPSGIKSKFGSTRAAQPQDNLRERRRESESK